jgi:metal-responsive CopG/Arc/MetJ family transcriptional regulator
MEGKKVKTTINIDEQLWTDFGVLVLQKHGGRKKNEVIEELIKKYIEENKPIR